MMRPNYSFQVASYDPRDQRAAYQAYPHSVSMTALLPPQQPQVQSRYTGVVDFQVGSRRAALTPVPKATDVECQDQCADDEVDGPPLEPSDKQRLCGVDYRPFLPPVLAVSTVLGGAFTFFFSFPFACLHLGISEAVTDSLAWCWFGLVAVTMLCFFYCAYADPGQVKKLPATDRDLEGGQSPGSPGSNAMSTYPESLIPPRADTNRMYPRPIRRYDHYCRWVTNCIGLLNHREFFVMVTGLCTVASIGGTMDIILLFVALHKGLWSYAGYFALHLGYSGILLHSVGPIFKVHVGLISRNELGREWNKNLHYVAPQCSLGRNVPVAQLPTDEYNELEDFFVYDATLNAYDKGLWGNWWTFWCTPRWSADQLGDF